MHVTIRPMVKAMRALEMMLISLRILKNLILSMGESHCLRAHKARNSTRLKP